MENNKKTDPTYNIQKMRQMRETYIWQSYHEKSKRFFKCNNALVYKKGHLLEGETMEPCVEKSLYPSPDQPPYDEFINKKNAQLLLRVNYFSTLFQDRSLIDGTHPQPKFSKLIIPEKKLKEIEQFIKENNLFSISDLLFEIIATAQEIYVREIVFWEKPENQSLIRNAQKEAQKVIKVIEQSNVDPKTLDENNRHQLDHINFVFNTETIKLEHDWLAREMVTAVMTNFNQTNLKDWKKELENYHLRYRKYSLKAQFKYKFTSALYKLLIDTKLFEINEESPTPNTLILCIAKILEFCLIAVGDFDESDAIKIKHVRNWLKRFKDEINPLQTPITPNKELLKKYFETHFIELVKDPKIDSTAIAGYICYRFDIPNLLPEIAHLTACIKASHSFVGFQLSSDVGTENIENPEFHAFKNLMTAIKDGKQLTSLTFELEGDSNQSKLTAQLPLQLISKALKEFYQNNPVEVESDLIENKLQRHCDGTIHLNAGNNFNKEHQRHHIKLVKATFNYLKAHSNIKAPKEMLSETYYQIIAVIFKDSGLFHSKMLHESEMIRKIKEWHKISASS